MKCTGKYVNILFYNKNAILTVHYHVHFILPDFQTALVEGNHASMKKKRKNKVRSGSLNQAFIVKDFLPCSQCYRLLKAKLINDYDGIQDS